MDYAIVSISGKQYVVKEGEEIQVEHLGGEVDKSRVFSDVLVLRKGELLEIGCPFVKDAKVTAHVLAHMKGKKIRVSKFKAKVHYDKTIGFRPMLTKIRIDSISLGQEEKKKEVKQVEEPKKEEGEMSEKKTRIRRITKKV